MSKFYLKDRNCDTKTQVYTIFYYKSKPKKIYTGIEIHPNNWNTNKQRAEQRKTFPNHKSINRKIEEITTRFLYAKTNLNEFRDFEEIKNYIKGVPIIDVTSMSVLQFFEQITLKKFPDKISIYNNLRQFCLINGEYSWSEIQKLHFAIKFQEYLESHDYTRNYVGKHFKVIKALLNSAYKEHELIPIPNTTHLKILREDIDHIYLSISELEKIFYIELDHGSKLDDARDRFLIGCFTGLRYNDFNRFDPNKHLINNKTMIKVLTGNAIGNKSTTVVIPVHPIVKSIMEKRKYILPKNIVNQKMNEYLKELGIKAKLNEIITFYRTEGGIRKEHSQPKYNLITTHTARRSFATNAFLSGMHPHLIMKITGHRTEKSFLKYIKATPEQAAQLMAKSSFFQYSLSDFQKDQ